MTFNNNPLYGTSFLVFLLSLFFMSSCEEPQADTQAEVRQTARSDDQIQTEAKKQFYHAWLADCVNDLAFKGKEVAITSLKDSALARIRGAINNAHIQAAFEKEELVWGPAFTVSPELSSIGGNSNYFISQNFMYCLKSTDSTGKPTYSVGIAGTNEISPFDWLNEDLQVENMKAWGGGGGKISNGALSGFNILNSLEDKGMSLKLFLENELGKNKHATIAIAGHSLGGALTQVYASFLSQSATLKSDHARIEAWVYAGPTAGNSAFADTLAKTLDGYFAYNNTLDVVPHAWQADSLNKLCDIYNNLSLCGITIESNTALKGVFQYLKDVSKNGDYTLPGRPTLFTGSHLTLGDTACQSFQKYLAWGWNFAKESTMYDDFYDIKKHCKNDNDMTSAEFYMFGHYLAEMGYQHTTAYFNNFFGAESSAFQEAVNKYIPGADTDYNDEEAVLIGWQFLNAVADFYEGKSPEVCDCSD